MPNACLHVVTHTNSVYYLLHESVPNSTRSLFFCSEVVLWSNLLGGVQFGKNALRWNGQPRDWSLPREGRQTE